MNADQITAIGTAIAAIITALGAVIAAPLLRSSKNGRRFDVAKNYCSELREQILGYGKTPKPWPESIKPTKEVDEDE